MTQKLEILAQIILRRTKAGHAVAWLNFLRQTIAGHAVAWLIQ